MNQVAVCKDSVKCDLFVPLSVFEFIPIESLIREHQQEYYAALEASDRSGDSTAFVHFSLGIIQEALEEFISSFIPKPLIADERMARAKEHFYAKPFHEKTTENYSKPSPPPPPAAILNKPVIAA